MNATATGRAATARPASRATISASLSSARCSSLSATATFGRALPSHLVSRNSTAFPAARRPAHSAASARSAGLAVRAVLDVDESTFEQEVLKVRRASFLSLFFAWWKKRRKGNAFVLQAPAFCVPPFRFLASHRAEQRVCDVLNNEKENTRKQRKADALPSFSFAIAPPLRSGKKTKTNSSTSFFFKPLTSPLPFSLENGPNLHSPPSPSSSTSGPSGAAPASSSPRSWRRSRRRWTES